jgi:hypothetical protein
MHSSSFELNLWIHRIHNLRTRGCQNHLATLIYYENSNDNRTPVGVLLLLFCGVFFASIERIGIFCGSTAYSDARRGMGIKKSFGVFHVLFYRNKKLGLKIRNLVLEIADFSVFGSCNMRKISLDTF